MTHGLKAGLLALALSAPAAWAQPAPVTIELSLPVACDFSTVCSIQKYVDRDPGPAATDYTCGRLTQDAHTGTDLRVPSVREMEQGVAVTAAAEGVVRNVRDGMTDISVRETGQDAVKGREAGNGVVIDHAGGWQTQYSHLRRGSVRVKPGDHVTAGQPLGLIGMSGNAEFPHLDFTVRLNGQIYDPFDGNPITARCGAPVHSLWSASARAALAYRPTFFTYGGFAAQAPEAVAARRGDYARAGVTRDSPALVFWIDASGIQAGDVERREVFDPAGKSVASSSMVHDKPWLSWFAFVGAKRPAGGWAAGEYRGRYVLSRGGKAIIEQEIRVVLK